MEQVNRILAFQNSHNFSYVIAERTKRDSESSKSIKKGEYTKRLCSGNGVMMIIPNEKKANELIQSV